MAVALMQSAPGHRRPLPGTPMSPADGRGSDTDRGAAKQLPNIEQKDLKILFSQFLGKSILIGE
ncbi:MAG TPA: hypothetical protein VMS37_29175 [Verrucomicrobiae bacterium]|nr:hypothetical protein [Verrucomicrobiae bacterium]